MTIAADILIVGGGMVGLVAAKGLTQQGWQVALLENQAAPQKPILNTENTFRVSAISLRSEQLLTQLGVWGNISEPNLGPYERMVVWDANTTAHIEMDAADIQSPYLGHIVPNDVMQYALYQQLQNEPDFMGLFAEQYTELQYTEGAWHARLKSGKVVTAKLLIGADGARSNIRKHLAIETDALLYGQSGIVANVHTELSHQNTAWQRFLTTGPLAVLPMQDQHECSIVWTVRTEEAERLLAASQNLFAQQLTEAFDGQLGKLSLLSKPVAFPLRRHHAKTYVSEQALLLGDAAHGIHPLAGQGVNLGFDDVAALLSVLSEAQMRKRPLGLFSDLKRYEQMRYHANQVMVHAMTGINTLFSNEQSLMMALRSRGMNFVNDQSWLKRFFIQHAAGQ